MDSVSAAAVVSTSLGPPLAPTPTPCFLRLLLCLPFRRPPTVVRTPRRVRVSRGHRTGSLQLKAQSCTPQPQLVQARRTPRDFPTAVSRAAHPAMLVVARPTPTRRPTTKTTVVAAVPMAALAAWADSLGIVRVSLADMAAHLFL